MYLKRLFHHNKILFAFILLFVMVQLLNNIRQDAAISPVYAYGMYSEIINPKKDYIIPEIIVNGKRLQTKGFSPQEWDKIELPLRLFRIQKEYNLALFKNHIQPLLHLSDSSKYINDITQPQFDNWYKQYLQTIIPAPVDSIKILWQEYFFDGMHFNPITISE